MPTMNKVDLMDCANGIHNFENDSSQCSVCGHERLEPYKDIDNQNESHGVEVWLCATIYVDAESDEEAEKIVSERYGGSLKCSEELMIGARDIRIGDDGEDFLSPTTSIYGLAGDSKLVPEAATAKAYVVIGEHFSVPNIVLKTFASPEAANREAASLVNIMLKDQEWPQTATADAWSAEIERLQDYHGAAHCYVEVTETELIGGAPDPVRDAASDMLAALREARSHLIVDKNEQGRVTGVSYDSEALRKIVAALDQGIAKAEGGAA